MIIEFILIGCGILIAKLIINLHSTNTYLQEQRGPLVNKIPSTKNREKLLKKEIATLEKEKLEVEVDLIEAKTELLEIQIHK